MMPHHAEGSVPGMPPVPHRPHHPPRPAVPTETSHSVPQVRYPDRGDRPSIDTLSPPDSTMNTHHEPDTRRPAILTRGVGSLATSSSAEPPKESMDLPAAEHGPQQGAAHIEEAPAAPAADSDGPKTPVDPPNTPPSTGEGSSDDPEETFEAWRHTPVPPRDPDTPGKHFLTVYDASVEIMRKTAAHPHAYRYAQSIGEEPLTDIPQGEAHELISRYHGAKNFYRNAERLYGAMLDIFDQAPTDDASITPPTQHAVRYTNDLVRDLVSVHEGHASIPGVPNMKGPLKMEARQANAILESEPIPPGVTMNMHANIPRFLTRPHTIPDTSRPLPEEILAAWHSLTPADTAYLGTADRLAAGQIPLHAGLEIADGLAATDPNLAYELKVGLVLNTMQQEEAMATKGAGGMVEAPLYALLTASGLSGDLGVKMQPYDIPGAVAHLLDETWDRAVAELQDGTYGKAVTFLGSTWNTYAGTGDLAFVAQAALRHYQTSGFDLMGTLREIYQHIPSLGGQLQDKIATFPHRPLLQNSEATHHAEQMLSDEPVTHTLDDVRRAAASLSGDASMASVKAMIGAEKDSDGVALLHATIDNDSAIIDAVVTFKDTKKGLAYTMPVTVDMQSGEVAMHTTDAEPLDETTLVRYKTAIERAIIQKSATKAAGEAKREAVTNGNGHTMQRQHEDTAAPTEQTPPTPKVKTTGQADERAQEQNTSPAQAAETTDTAARVRLAPMVESEAQRLVSSAGISDASGTDIMRLVNRRLQRALAGGGRFVKPVTTEGSIRGGDRVKLGYISLSTEHHPDVRIYLKQTKDGAWQLCGIHKKQGATQQQTYLEKLVNRILKDEQETSRPTTNPSKQAKGGKPRR